MQQAIGASQIFTGETWLDDHVIIVSNGMIEDIIRKENLQAGIPLLFYNDNLLVPPFIDLQVYGAAGRLLAVYPDVSTLEIMLSEFQSAGTSLFLPTVATNTIEVFRQCIDAVGLYWQQGGRGIPGLHLEGPWLNEEKRGAHVKEWIHAPSISEVKELLEYGKGVIRMITLAPENCTGEIINLIKSHNIILSAGHSNATYEQAIESFDNGIRAVTHLYNAMSPMQHRSPGLVGAAFNHHSVMASIIPDGYHVDFAAIVIAKKIMGERLFAITDAVTGTSSGPYQHQLSGDKYECNEVLSGSALTMHKAFLNLVEKAGIEKSEALRMCSLYPAKLLGMDGQYGKIVPQASGQFLLLTKQLGMAELITLQ